MGTALTVLVVLFVVAVFAGAVWLMFTMVDAWQQNAQDVLNSGSRRREGRREPPPPDDERPGRAE